MNKMSKLEEVVWDRCVYRKAAPDIATRERWENDRLAAYQEHFRVRPLPAQYNMLLQEALAEWLTIETLFLSRIGMTIEEFDTQFSIIREGFLKEDRVMMRTARSIGKVAYGAVFNFDVVNCFACFLPHTFPERHGELAKIGRRIAAIFYLECIAKAGTTEKVDAAWQYAGMIDETFTQQP